MNIVFVGTFAMAPKSTMKVRALPLAQALVRREHRVTMVLPPWDNPADAGATWETQGVRVINLPLPPRVPLAWYGQLTWRLLRRVQALHPDVLHAFKPKGFSGQVAQALLAQRAMGGAPTRVVVDTDDWEGTGGWNDRGLYPWWQRVFFAYQERWLLRHADAVTAASRTLMEMSVGERTSSQGVFYVPNGTAGRRETQESERSRLRKELQLDEGPVLLLYTRFVEFAPQRAAGLLQAIVAEGERPNVLLVGTGLHGEEAVFLAKIRELGLPLQIVNAGWVPEEALPNYFALADVALFPMDDTLVNRAKCSAKLVDLLSAGVPVVAEAVGQSREYIEDGLSGLLVPSGDAKAFAAAVIRLLRDDQLQARLGKAAAKRMATFYTWDRLASVAEKAYEG